jgi:F-type H+-transporting ATPase subunit c
MIYLAVLAFGVTFGLPIAVIFASTAQGKATSTALEGIARQPEGAGQIQTAMIIGLALIESLVIYSLLMFFLLMGKLPTISEVETLIKAGATVQTPDTQ